MAIEAKGLEIQIGARTLLHPTDFHVSKGDKIGLVGRNGAGKTTLTRVITGDMLPTAAKCVFLESSGIFRRTLMPATRRRLRSTA